MPASPPCIAQLAVDLARVAPARERDAERIGAALAAVDQDAFARYLAERRLLALIGTRAAALGVACGPALHARVAAAVRENAVRGMLHEHALATALAALDAEGIAALPLKGVALARVAHGDVGLRSTSDTDILVDSHDLGRAIAVLQDAGYAAPTDPPWVDGRPLLHYTMPHRDGIAPPLELHWRIHWSETAFSEALLAGSKSDELGRRRPALADELASLLLFYARDGFSGLRLAADVAAWWDRFGDGLTDGALEPYLEAHPALRRSFDAALLALSTVVALPAERLVRDLRPDRSARRAARLADPYLTAPPGRVTARIMAVDCLLSTGADKRGFLRRYALHPEGEVRRLYGLHDRGRTVVALRSAVHAVGAVVKGGPPMARALLVG